MRNETFQVAFMLIQEHDHPLNRALEAYLAGEWLWEGQICRSAVCIDGDGGMRPVGTAAPADLQAEDFDAALAGRAEVILVGTGAVQRFLHPRLAACAAAAGAGVEYMDTEAACRTYLLLHSEGRRAWAWLWPAAFR